MSADDRLLDQARAASSPIYRATRDEILEYYHDEYEDEWKGELVEDLMDLTGLKRASLMRRYQGGRENSPRISAKTRAEYEALGQQLPPLGYKPPAGGYKVTFVGEIKISKDCYERHFTVHITGGDAEDLANIIGEAEDGDLSEAWEMIFYQYFGEELAEDYCGDPSITITPA